MASKANSDPKNGFFQQVYDIVAQVPKGQALSYGQIAQMLGRPRAARMVGWAMRRCPEELPWHRVVKADGSIAGGGQSELRRALLEGEGVPFLPDGRVDWKALRERRLLRRLETASAALGYSALFGVSVITLAGATFNPFIYFQF